jgi:hypothetical protein
MNRSEPASVTVYTAPGCHLCEAALEVIERVRVDVAFTLEILDITGDDDLESRYRELIPAIEIDGKRAFTYHVTADGLRAALL